jgi:hypothetical protein
MYYFVEIDNGVCIKEKQYPHSREGLEKAFEEINSLPKKDLIIKIYSSREELPIWTQE